MHALKSWLMQKAGHAISCLYTSLPLKRSYSIAQMWLCMCRSTSFTQMWQIQDFFYPPKMQLTCSQYAVCLSLAGIFGGKLLPFLHPPSNPLPLPRFSIIGIKYLHGRDRPGDSLGEGGMQQGFNIVFGLSAVRSQTTESVVLLKVHKIEIFFTPILEFVLFLF